MPLTKKILTWICLKWDARIAFPLGVAPTITQNVPSFILPFAKYLDDKMQTHACLLSNIHLNATIKQVFWFLFFFICVQFCLTLTTPLLNMQNKRLLIGWIWPSAPKCWSCEWAKNESVHSCPTTIKRCKGHNTRGRDTNH